ncbi:Putative SOS response-associated peptidase YedK [Polaromonas sp. OV174]|uniref:SOS response-associated peptidase n=1 Tax=Polaromonas sp. OV174 TaxID=1855300 RepID=UPI0008E171E7|nr:SOS response-associated peptidase family protein [Polaromonas sp. OV174]SFC33678.1 Putative SOS response-associated peptidase YedK [Polaromonas sp. OV174]
MCNQYTAPKPSSIAARFGVPAPDFEYPEHVYKGYVAPMLRRAAEDSTGLMLEKAHFGLVPFFAESTKLKYDTFNARSETIATLDSFRLPWRRRQFCLVPMQAFVEPNYESGKSQWWQIGRQDGGVMAVAGLYDRWTSAEGEIYWSFTLPTLNADEHPLMRRFHKPGKEKRSIVVLPPSRYDAWLDAKSDEDARTLIQLFDETEFTTGPVESAQSDIQSSLDLGG